MNLLNLIRSMEWSYKLGRQGLMTYRRWRFGLDNVHPTFYMARGCRVSSDLTAHEYSFVNIGCILGPKVELGRYAMLAPYVTIVGGDHVHDIPGKPIIFSGRPEISRRKRYSPVSTTWSARDGSGCRSSSWWGAMMRRVPRQPAGSRR